MLSRGVISTLGLLASNAAALKLLPISNPAEWTAQHTSTRDVASTNGELDLHDAESFFWGAATETKLIYANLTVSYPEKNQNIVSMERFADKLKSVNCSNDMMLEFTDDSTFEYAKGVWNWVNSDVNNTFIMVTDYAGCANDTERLPFEVSNITYDEEANKAFLTAEKKCWKDVAHSYTLNVGHEALSTNHKRMVARELLSRDTDFSISLASSYNSTLFSTTISGWTTTVGADILTTGSIDVDFDLKVDWFNVTSASMTVQPEDVTAAVKLALTESGALTQAYNWKETLVSVPIVGFEIANILSLGASLDIDVGATLDSINGTASVGFGAKASLSNSAIVTVDLVNSKNNAISGWTPTFEALPFSISAEIDGSAQASLEPYVKLEASVFGLGFNVGLDFQLPYVHANFSALANNAGVCSSNKTLGVDLAVAIGVDISAQASVTGSESDPFWNQTLFGYEWPLVDQCFAFGPDQW